MISLDSQELTPATPASLHKAEEKLMHKWEVEIYFHSLTTSLMIRVRCTEDDSEDS